MIILGIHPAQIAFLEAMARGERIIYHRSMHLLFCFSPSFDLREQYACRWVFPGMHDLLHPLYGPDSIVVGIKFWCLRGLLTETNLLKTQDADSNLIPIRIFEHGVTWTEKHSPQWGNATEEKREKSRELNRLGADFLRNYPPKVSFNIWKQALPEAAS